MRGRKIPYQARAVFACFMIGTDEPILVREGVEGYWPAEGWTADTVNEFNKRQGWTADEVESAHHASVFGWHTPIAISARNAIKRVKGREADIFD